LAEDDVINLAWAYCRPHWADDTAVVYVHSSDIMAATKRSRAANMSGMEKNGRMKIAKGAESVGVVYHVMNIY